MKVVYPYDTTPFVRVAINEVMKTLVEAIVLVFLVMYLFMGNMRATLIPTIAVPVVLLGTFLFWGLFGFSINMLTMFAMVLAIGLLVDDAIVVVENVERLMSEEGLSPLEATRKSMDQITPALIGIGLVLSAVFGPMAFFRRLHRRHLSPVLHHHRRGDAALGGGGLGADARAVRHAAQAGGERPRSRGNGL
jgi:multidrug efflux pump subunit AcrB